MTKMKFLFITREGQGKKKNSDFQTGFNPSPRYQMKMYHVSFFFYYNFTYKKEESCS